MIDLSKLSPAPWYTCMNGVAVCSLCDCPGSDPVGEQERFTIAKTWSAAASPLRDISATNAKFIALARNAFDVMMRRKWSPRPMHGGWFIVDRNNAVIWLDNKPAEWTDPFTALVEADKWLTAQEATSRPGTSSGL